jgi:hypothetical protein
LTQPAPLIRSRIEPSAEPSDLSPRQVGREFHKLLGDGMRIRPAGTAKSRPRSLLSGSYAPRYKTELFDTTFYLSKLHQNADFRFFVAYVVQGGVRGQLNAYPRIFYKDVSLIWRSASHFIRTQDENWIGKGELRTVLQDGKLMEVTAEETTDLPLELQNALEAFARQPGRIPNDERAIGLVLRRGPSDRMDPYHDFIVQRQRARTNPRNLVNAGRPISRFTRRNDPTSLRFVKGYEPDFNAVIEVSDSVSKLYGGALQRYRILSRNRKIQYLFFAGPRHVWIIPPQTTTTELTDYGLRSIDVITDEDMCLPGFEYHFLDENEYPPVFVSQIPDGYAGPASDVDGDRADTSRWLDRLPVVQEFRRKILGRIDSCPDSMEIRFT